MTRDPGAVRGNARDRRWAYAPVLILSVLLSIQAVLVTLAVRDPTFAVEPDYWRTAMDFDAERRAEETPRRLGWQVRLRVHEPEGGRTQERRVTLQATGSDGAPLPGARASVRAFHLAGGAQEERLSLTPSSATELDGVLRAPRPGHWEFRWELHAAGEVARGRERVELPRMTSVSEERGRR